MNKLNMKYSINQTILNKQKLIKKMTCLVISIKSYYNLRMINRKQLRKIRSILRILPPSPLKNFICIRKRNAFKDMAA